MALRGKRVVRLKGALTPRSSAGSRRRWRSSARQASPAKSCPASPPQAVRRRASAFLLRIGPWRAGSSTSPPRERRPPARGLDRPALADPEATMVIDMACIPLGTWLPGRCRPDFQETRRRSSSSPPRGPANGFVWNAWRPAGARQRDGAGGALPDDHRACRRDGRRPSGYRWNCGAAPAGFHAANIGRPAPLCIDQCATHAMLPTNCTEDDRREKPVTTHRIGIIGLGKIAHDQHIPVISRQSAFELVA